MFNTPMFLFVIREILHDSYLLFPEPDGNMKYISDSELCEMTVVDRVDSYKPDEEY